jgi:hypothetical protein
MNAALRSSSGETRKLKPVERTISIVGGTMLLWRVTIVCLMIAGIAIIAGLFVDRKYDVYRDQPVVAPITAMQLKHMSGGQQL